MKKTLFSFSVGLIAIFIAFCNRLVGLGHAVWCELCYSDWLPMIMANYIGCLDDWYWPWSCEFALVGFRWICISHGSIELHHFRSNLFFSVTQLGSTSKYNNMWNLALKGNCLEAI